MAADYYLSRKNKLLKAFRQYSKCVEPILSKRYGQELSAGILREARNEYETLVPQIPYIGGSHNHMTQDLTESVQMLAFLRVLRRRGVTAQQCCEITYRGLETRLARYPRFLLRLIGRYSFSRVFVGRLQRQAVESQKRVYPGDFVFDVILGDGKEFDWGLDFSECGIRKFYQAQNALEFMPYVCLVDYALSEAFGYGLVRTKTLAEGADRCNPRMKRKGRTERRFPPGFLEE
jgi:hypothetical protein